MSLRDKLLASLTELPGTRMFHVHVLTSSPRKHNGLFPYAHPRPRAYLQDVLILLSEQTSPDAPRVLVSAIEASVYNIPATSCGVLYISKVDSSGHAAAPSPTATLVRSFLMFYSDPTTRPIDVQHLWIQLFARAQGQYLFPNSSDFSGKRPLSDVKLCAWWKRVFTDVSVELNARMKSRANIKLYYILPGYNELDAQRSLDTPHGPLSADHPPSIGWIYGHPYSQHDIPLPCPQSSSDTGSPSLAQLIPSFDDDPKSRFMDEIAHTTDAGGVRSPKRKRPNFASRLPHADEEDKPEPERSHGELEKVSADEFWERMSFRQECTAGAMTGFFAMGISLPVRGSPVSAASPLAPQPGQVAPRMVRRVVATLLNHHEFSTAERAVRATETLEGAIKGLCEDLAAAPESAPSSSRDAPRFATPEPGPSNMTLEVPRTPPPRRECLPEVSPNPFPDPVASLETYRSYIYGAIAVRNAPLPPKADAGGTSVDRGARASSTNAPQVTVLTARKKRKVTAPP